MLAIYLYLFLLGYVICGYLNNTFVLTTDKLLVINPNFPFTKIVTYKLNQIDDIEIYHSLLLQGICWIFFQSGNYVTITTGGYNFRYYCGSLCGDTYDENFTEKTIDDLHYALKERNIPVQFRL
ncbi:hypothetical protein QNI16_21055 [Cytophagaceae bacterium YF14B1]|uniref:Uncharacterized protein n=1 Tax=Xanthocytophaga flava TaxID=3048013 RepID=A0AAE3UAQ9_9BACT|nr:hypothetical protein [Xanthocytophaga flavus]MDJ1483004.1 hypothetical protein [Xanthocytophaga flavus]